MAIRFVAFESLGAGPALRINPDHVVALVELSTEAVGIFLVGGAQFDVKGSLHHVESLLVHHGVKTS